MPQIASLSPHRPHCELQISNILIGQTTFTPIPRRCCPILSVSKLQLSADIRARQGTGGEGNKIDCLKCSTISKFASHSPHCDQSGECRVGASLRSESVLSPEHPESGVLHKSQVWPGSSRPSHNCPEYLQMLAGQLTRGLTCWDFGSTSISQHYGFKKLLSGTY